MEILEQVPINELIEHLMLVYKHQPDFLPEIEFDEVEGMLRKVEKKNAMRLNFFEPEMVIQFDNFLAKACEICILDNLDFEEKEMGWFAILHWL